MRAGRLKIAIVLFNLGGPDGPQSVRPFLENLFSDPAIIAMPTLFRRPLAALIARTREKAAIANYALMGGGSPLLPETRSQAEALEAVLAERFPDTDFKIVIAMRYWGPTTAQAADDVRRFAPEKVVLLPLYPQYSTTTTGSSLNAWREVYSSEVHGLCCWYDNEGLIESHARQIRQTWEDAGRPSVRLLFSAHGLPEKVVTSGDPYQWQIENTCAKVAERLGPGWDWKICYQSRVGPLRWIGPSTAEAVIAAAAEGLGIIVDPIAFVSEHIETLVELDRDYAELAASAGASIYLRVPAPGVIRPFVEGLADAVERALDRPGCHPSGTGCPAGLSRCGREETLHAL